jgi:hypothetical protein
MATCDNCSAEATHAHEPAGVSKALYCAAHLPKNLTKVANELLINRPKIEGKPKATPAAKAASENTEA